MANPTPPTWWDEAVHLKDRMQLTQLADHLGIPVSTLAAEFKERQVRRRIRVAEEEPEVAAVAPEAPSAATLLAEEARRQGSKDAALQALFHLLGKVPDSEVARLAQASVRTVASYRARHGIRGYDGPRRRPPTRGRKESRVDDYASLLGQVPDRVIADLAGMSLGAVRNFRIKRNVEPAGRITRREIEAIVRTWQGAAPADESAPSPKRSGGSKPKARAAQGASSPSTGPSAWRVRTASASWILVAHHLEHAVAEAVRLAGGEQAIEGIEALGAVLQLR